MKASTTMTEWTLLPRNNKGKIKLKNKGYTLSDVVDELIHLKSQLIRYITKEQLDTMIQQREGIDTIDPYISIPIYKTVQDKKNNTRLYMVYGNHGEIFFTPHETLESYVLDDPNFFWDYKLPDIANLPHNGKHALSYTFSEDEDAVNQWNAALNYDIIFETFGIDGGGEKSCLMGFFFIQ